MSELPPRLVIGALGSRLSGWQAERVANKIRLAFPRLPVVVVNVTSEDRARGDKHPKMAARPIEQALADRVIDLGVHSLKDLPLELPEGLELGAVLERLDWREVLITRGDVGLEDLPLGARVGVTCLRQEAQMRAVRPDLFYERTSAELDQLLQMVDEGKLDATVVPAAGLIRLGISHQIKQPFARHEMLPAVGQGVIAVESRAGELEPVLSALEDVATRQAIEAERELLRALGASTSDPVGCLGEVVGEKLRLEAVVLSPLGQRCVRDSIEGLASEAAALGQRLANRMHQAGAIDLLCPLESQ